MASAPSRPGFFGWRGPTEEEKERALQDPGPSWHEWLYYDFLKVWLLLGLLIVDVWDVGTFAQPLNVTALLLSLAALLYAELLLYRYLWYRPTDRDVSQSVRHEPFHPSWLRPVAYGRWTPEAERARHGRDPYEGYAKGADPREFL